MRSALGLGCASVLLFAGACVGDDPALTGGPDATTDGSTGPGNGDGGGDSTVSDASGGADAGPPPVPEDKVSWAHYVPTLGNDDTYVAVDPAGYAAVAHKYLEQPPDVPAAPYGGVYITRLDPSGKAVWKKGVVLQGSPPAVRMSLNGVAVDADGNVYVAGSTQATLDFGGGVTVAGGGQYKDVGWVVKLDAATGTGVWKRTFVSTSSEAHLSAIAVRGEHVAIVGRFFDGVAYEKTSGPASEAGTATFVARLERATGKAAWLSTGTNDKQILSGGVTLDDGGGIYAGFWFDAPITGWGNPSSVGMYTDGLVVAFDGSGAPRWKRVFGKAGSTTYGSVKRVAWNANTLAVVGRTPAGIDFGDGKPLGTSGPSDPYVATLDPATGALRWARAIGNDHGGDDDESLNGVAVDAWGQVIVSGSYRKSLVIAGKALPEPPTELVTAAFGAKLDAAGTFVWSKAIVSTTWANAESVSAGPGGHTVATLAISGTVDLGAGVKVTTPSGNKSLGVVGWTP